MAILYAFHPFYAVRAEFLVEKVNQRTCILCREIAAIMGFDSTVLANADDVAAKSEVERLHLVTDGSGLKRTATFVNLVEVIAEYSGVGNLRTWVIALRNGYEATSTSHLCQHIHVRSLGELQRSLSAEFINGFICHSIAQNYYVLHNRFSFKCLRLT